MTSYATAAHDLTHRDTVTSRPVVGLDDEPSLVELLDDPVIQAVMAQDGVAREEIIDLVASIQSSFDR